MKKYIVFDDLGVLRGRFIEGVHTIPSDAVEVAADLWNRTIQETDRQWVLDKKGEISKRPHPLPTKTKVK